MYAELACHGSEMSRSKILGSVRVRAESLFEFEEVCRLAGDAPFGRTTLCCGIIELVYAPVEKDIAASWMV